MGQANVRKINGTYGKMASQEIQEETKWKQLPNTLEMRNLLMESSIHNRKSNSYHESGHAVFSELAGIAVEFVTACPFYDTRHGWASGVMKPVDDVIDVSSKLCGYIEGILAGDLTREKAGFAEKATSDYGQLERLAIQVNALALRRGHLGKVTVQQAYVEFTPRVNRKLDDPQVWAAIESLAARLRESEVVQGDEVREIVARCCPTFAKAA